MAFPYKKIALFGATSGIGRALAERLVENGCFVIVIGRRKDRLEAFVDRYGKEKSEARVFDITKLDLIPGFVADITPDHTDLDLALINSGIQRQMNFAKPETVEIETIREEFVTNYLSQVALTKAILPHLISRGKQGKTAGICYTTSALGLVPGPPVPNYSATKAAMHSFILTLREQVKGSGVEVLELLPPAVQTELHGEGGKAIGMPLAEFIDEAWEKFQQGKDQVAVGMAQVAYDAFEIKRQELFHRVFGYQAR